MQNAYEGENCLRMCFLKCACACICFLLGQTDVCYCNTRFTCVLVRMCGCFECVRVVSECLLVLATVVFNPPPEA